MIVSSQADIVRHNGVALLACVYTNMTIEVAVSEFVNRKQQQRIKQRRAKELPSDDDVRKLYLQGKPMKQCAKELNVSYSCIQKRIAKMKIARKCGGKYGV